MLKPKLLTTLRNYSWNQFSHDSIAGIIVGVIAIPLAIAFAIASGVSPEKGLYTAVIGGFVVSVLGGSRVQIAGPTGAFIVIVYGVVMNHGLEGLFLATIMAGFLLILLGLAGFGSAIKFIPYPLIVGFTSGIAVIIFSSQVKDILGLSMGEVPAEFLSKWTAYAQSFHTINYYTAALSLGCIALIILWKKVPTKIPGFLVTLIASTLAVHFFHLPVETIGSRFGEIPHGLPKLTIPPISIQKFQELSSPAITIALLAGIESLLSAVVADGMIGGKHRSNMELIAQGFANILSPLFGGIPVTGAIARTAANIQNGGRTPISGIIHSVFVLMAMLYFGNWIEYVPLAALAAMLAVVAYNMSEYKSFLMLLRSPRSDVAVLLATFFLTVIVDLTVAIQTGMVLSVFLFMRRMSMVANVEVITRELTDQEESDDPMAISKKYVPEGVEIFEVTGPFFFGASYKFIEAASNRRNPRVRIIRMRNVPTIDATGLHALEEQFINSKKQEVDFIISGIQSQPLTALERTGLLDKIGRKNVLKNIDEALKRAEDIILNKS
jgi:SulP family sulfate permease